MERIQTLYVSINQVWSSCMKHSYGLNPIIVFLLCSMFGHCIISQVFRLITSLLNEYFHSKIGVLYGYSMKKEDMGNISLVTVRYNKFSNRVDYFIF